MIAIGNNEKCPYCELIMKDFKIGGEDSLDHFVHKHGKEFGASMEKDRHG